MTVREDGRPGVYLAARYAPRNVSWDDVERLRAALRARLRALEEAPSARDDAPLDRRPTRSRHPAPGKARGGDAAERLQERGR